MLAEAAADPIVLRGVGKGWPEGHGAGRLIRRLRGRGSLPRRPVFANVDLRVGRGEIVALLGENGVGKTTLLRIVAGLARADAGDVDVLGGGRPAGSPALRDRISYAGADHRFFPRLTVRRNLRFFASLAGLGGARRERRIAELLATVDLERYAGRRVEDVSSGTRQRLSIARALVADPEILLLDEPSHTLDPLHASAIRSLIRDELAGRRGKTVVVATNVLDEARELAGRVVVLRDGRLVELARDDAALASSDAAALFGKPVA